MAVLKAKTNAGQWIELAMINHVIEVAPDMEWKELTVTGKKVGDVYCYDFTAADIDLLESDNWILCTTTTEYGGPAGFYIYITEQPLFVTPILAKLQNEDMSNSWDRCGSYTMNVSRDGFVGSGSAMFTRRKDVVSMYTGVHTSNVERVYSHCVDLLHAYASNKATLIYLGNKEV